MKKISILFIFLLLSWGCATAAKNTKTDTGNTTAGGDKVITTTGMADIRQAGESEAYDRAIDDAQRKAVEEAIGTFIDSQTMMQNGTIIKDELSARTSGYIKERKILRKWKEDKIVNVEIKCTIGLDKLKDDVMALDVMQKRMNMPRVIFYVKESMNGKNNSGTSGSIYNELVKKFTEKRFVIISRNSVQLDPEEAKLMANLDNADMVSEIAVKIGQKNNADIVVTGKGNSGEATGVGNLYGTSMKSYQADVYLQVINVADRKILATSTKHGAAPHINAETGCVNAFIKASDPAADDLMDQVLKAWEDIQNNGNLLTLYADGLSISEGFKFQKALQQYFREVKEVYSKDMQNGVSQYMVKYLGAGKDFAMALSTVSFGYTVEVTSFDAQTVKLKVSK
jgi:hypothetical protein